MASRDYTYYDSDNKPVNSPHVAYYRAHWDKVMPGVDPKWIKSERGYAYGYQGNEKVRVERVVAYKTRNPSKHVCGAKCRNATGPNCECSCGGEHHGADA